MDGFVNHLKMAAGVAGAAIGSFLGGFDGTVYALICFTAADYLSGLACAVSEKELSSAVGFKGIFKKIMIFLLVGIAHLLDQNVLGGTAALKTAVAFFYIANEGVSILENAARLGLPVPSKIKAILSQMRERE